MSNNSYTKENETADIIIYADSIRWKLGEDFHDLVIESIFNDANKIANKVVKFKNLENKNSWELNLDRIVTSKLFGFPIMFVLLAIVFWLTIEGSNVPSSMIAGLLVDTLHPILKNFSAVINALINREMLIPSQIQESKSSVVNLPSYLQENLSHFGKKRYKHYKEQVVQLVINKLLIIDEMYLMA